MSKDIRVISKECCDIWNNLKDKTQMIDYLIESKQQIADLEAKLTEKDKAIKNWETMYKSVVQTCHNDKEEIERLSNELKDMSYSSSYQEYLVLREKLEVEQTTNKVLIEREKKLKNKLAQKEKELKAKETLNQIFKDNREAKISFAVEQLEQLKYNIRLDNSDEETGDMPYVVDTTCLFELIDNQIEELTHQHENKGE